MPDLEGNLKVFGPITALQMPNLEQASGKMELITDGNSATIFFERGNVIYADMANEPARLGEYLVKYGLITRQVLEKALKLETKGKRLDVVLVELGIIPKEDLRAALKEKIKEVIYEIVRWREGRFVFTSNEKPDSLEVLIDSPLDHLMLEGVRRMDESSVK
jgi:hypothetical protein